LPISPSPPLTAKQTKRFDDRDQRLAARATRRTLSRPQRIDVAVTQRRSAVSGEQATTQARSENDMCYRYNNKSLTGYCAVTSSCEACGRTAGLAEASMGFSRIIIPQIAGVCCESPG
jgi:hypothetical protein